MFVGYEIVEWDSKFFGITVARITQSNLNEEELSEILFELKSNNIALVYWSTIRECEKNVIKRLGGVLADNKKTFFIDFVAMNLEEGRYGDIVEEYTPSMSIKELEMLAIQSGEYSRFAVDPKIPREKFFDLYKIWINRSIKKEIAEEVLVVREKNKTVGMVTLGNKNGRGDIGLLSVEKNYRGKKYGEILVRAAQCWFVANGYKCGQVVTQGANVPACNLYEKCGYSVESMEYLYHFWL